MSLLEVKNLSMEYGDKLLFSEGNFELYKGEHMGLVGENGSGKSTLLKILLDKELPDNGSVIWQKNIKIGYIDQYLKAEGNLTVYEYLKTAFKEAYELEKELNSLYEDLAIEYNEYYMEKIGVLQEELEHRDFYSLENKIDKVITGLGINSFGEHTYLDNLSGGQQSKVILARLLLEEADVLLLDEPTNFLDYGHVVWLMDYLKNFKGAFMVISHNIEFLNDITTCILDIEFCKMKKYYGNYDKFLRLKEEYKESYIREYGKQQEYIKKTEEYIRRNKAGVNSKMARGRQKQLDRVVKLDTPSENRKPIIDFKTNYSAGRIKLKELEVGYTHALLPKLNLNIENDEKVVISGFNGIGKSTLLKTIMGEIDKISGEVICSKDIKIGYYEQELNWEDENQNAMEIVRSFYPRLKTEEIRRNLNKCGIESKDLDQAIGTLSGGEQSKVKLCIMTLRESNVLILDEPTNHLDKVTKEVLKEALINFEGSVILVSHEKDFYDGWVDKVYKI